jgi:hypothetical protein
MTRTPAPRPLSLGAVTVVHLYHLALILFSHILTQLVHVPEFVHLYEFVHLNDIVSHYGHYGSAGLPVRTSIAHLYRAPPRTAAAPPRAAATLLQQINTINR